MGVHGFGYTFKTLQPWTEAVVVMGCRVVYVGGAARITRFVGKGAKKVYMTGKMIFPGFVSTYDYLVASAWINRGGELFDIEAREGVLKRTSETVETNPDPKVIKGIG